MMNESYRETTVEALILASPEPLAGGRIARMLNGYSPSKVAQVVAQLNDGYAEKNCSFRIRELAGGYQFYILPEYVDFVEEMFSSRRRLRLSRAALETAAIIAYRQPVTKPEIEHVRGVASDGVLRTLMEKNLITITGRSSAVGKPLQYGTTDEFLKFFGLARLDDLPSMAEIEELIASTDEKSQTELKLEVDADGRPLKLNVADGTFDPESRDQREDVYREESETGGENAAGGPLVLKKTTEEEATTADSDTSSGEAVVATVDPAGNAGQDS
jgi:segregation and condensation protein B